MVKNLERIFKTFERTKMENLCISELHTAETIAGLIWHDAVESGNALCIVNTTETAKNIYHAIKKFSLPILRP